MKNYLIIILLLLPLFLVRGVGAQRILDYDTCTYLKRWLPVNPGNEIEATKQYDTLCLYIQKCATKDDLSWYAFTHLNGAAQFMSADSSRFDRYRTWLISVLFLNSVVPEYFCACMGSISNTYQYGKYSPLAHLSVQNYIRNYHPECLGTGSAGSYARDSAADAFVKIGEYSVNNLPPLDSIELGFLLHQNSVSSPKFTQTYLSSFTSSPNPFIKETTLEFELNRMAFTTITIYDELGRLVWGDGRGSSLEAGEHSIHLDGSTFPHGILYARISTGFGEVKTIKLQHF